MEFAFALFSPDCVLSGNVQHALRFVQDRGLRIIARRWHQLSTTDVAALYAPNRRSRPVSLLDSLVDELFSFSASLCCIVTSRQGLGAESLHRLLLDLKGPSDPFNCNPGQLRRALGATNKILNLVHTSDSPVDSTREAAIFFPDVGRITRSNIEADAPLSGSDSGSGHVSISGFRTLNELKLKVIRACAEEPALRVVGTLLEREQELLQSQPDHVTTFPQLTAILAQQAAAMPSLRSAAVRAVISRLIATGCRTPQPGNAGLDNSPSTAQMLERMGITISAWESLMIRVEEGSQPRRAL